MLPIDVPPPHNRGVELGPEARRNAYPSEPETTLGPQARRGGRMAIINSHRASRLVPIHLGGCRPPWLDLEKFQWPKGVKMPKFSVFSTWVRIEGKSLRGLNTHPGEFYPLP